LFLILFYSTIPIHHYRELKMSQDPNSWTQHLAAIDAEGITTKAYADREGLSARQIYDRRKSKVEKLRKQISTPKPVQSDKFVRISTPLPVANFRCELELPAGIRLRLSALPDVAWLTSLCQAAQPGRSR